VDYASALKRVRLLVLAKNALEDALEDALAELEKSAAAEGKRMVSIHPSQRPAPSNESGMRPKFELTIGPDETVKKKPG
jgi:hypothetical protein